MKIGRKKLTLFEIEKRPRSKRQPYLLFGECECSAVVMPTGKSSCTSCKSKIKKGEKAYHIKNFISEMFSVFMCEKCFGIFQKDEMKI